MLASRLFSSLGASIFRRHVHHSLHIASPLHPIIFANPNLRFRRQCSSAATSDCVHTFPVDGSENPVSACRHPWPEWVNFVDCLKTKGYLTKSSTASSLGVTTREGKGHESVYTDTNILKNACLSFGRDRFDMLKMLSTQDMQSVVEKGCPNLFRKAVNSAKRLRVHLQLNEGHACGACNLRGSCDKAYVILKESEGNARTVDIVRLLFMYALDPLVTSGGDKPPGRELIEASVRKLLLELIELSETPIDPKLTKPTPLTVPEMKRSTGSIVDDVLKSDEIKELLTGREINKRKKAGRDNVTMKKGDWICTKCNFMNYARNMQCLECKAEAPKRFYGNDDIEIRKGDWKCIKCEFINFASRSSCKMCTELKPKRQLNPGEWECPSCDFVNFRKNMVCKKCNHGRPTDLLTEKRYEEHLWRKPG